MVDSKRELLCLMKHIFLQWQTPRRNAATTICCWAMQENRICSTCLIPYKSLQPSFLHLLFLCLFGVVTNYWDNIFTISSWLTGWLGEWACFPFGFGGSFNVWGFFGWLIGGLFCSFVVVAVLDALAHSLICACLGLCPQCNWVCTQLMWAALAIHWEGVTLTGQRI